MSRDLTRALKAVAASADDAATGEVALEGEIMRPARALAPTVETKWVVVDGEIISASEFAARLPQREIVPVDAQAGRALEPTASPDAEWEADDIMMLLDSGIWFSDMRSPAEQHEDGKAPGFCAGCGAHHVREKGRMLCVECNGTFRDIG